VHCESASYWRSKSKTRGKMKRKDRERDRRLSVILSVKRDVGGGEGIIIATIIHSSTLKIWTRRIVFHLMVNTVAFSPSSFAISFITPLSLRYLFRLSACSCVCVTRLRWVATGWTNNSIHVAIMPDCHVAWNKTTKYVSTSSAISYSEVICD